MRALSAVLACLLLSSVSWASGFTMAPIQVYFFPVLIGQGADETIRLTNYSGKKISNVTFEYFFINDLDVLSDCIAQVNPDETCTFIVSFTPHGPAKINELIKVKVQYEDLSSEESNIHVYASTK